MTSQRSREKLIEQLAGTTLRPGELYAFWHGSRLSQWARAPFTIDGITYPTAEHWMMVAKARLFNHEAAAERILASGDPAKAKALGRSVVGFRDDIWSDQRRAIVHAGSIAKFSQNQGALEELLETGDRVIVEASPSDRIWGAGMVADRAISDPRKWPGLNLLGFVLMDVRDELRHITAGHEG